jgi:hypothetical protein
MAFAAMRRMLKLATPPLEPQTYCPLVRLNLYPLAAARVRLAMVVAAVTRLLPMDVQAEATAVDWPLK